METLIVRFMLWLRAKLNHYLWVIRDVDATCPICHQEVTIGDLNACEIDGCYMCEECMVVCDDVVLCKNHAPNAEDLEKYGVERED